MRYAKFFVAAAGACATSLVTVFGPDSAVGQIATVVLATLTALAVFLVPNVTPPVPVPSKESSR